MRSKTARSALVTIAVLAVTAGVVNSAPAGEDMTFQKYPDAFGGPVAHRVHARPLDRVPASAARALRPVRCAPGAAAAGTICFVAAR
jgi:hypothetical protein